MKKTFQDIGYTITLQKGLEQMQISTPTDVQEITAEPFLCGKDILVQAQTGSGKTLAYLLPIFQNIDKSLRKTQAIVLTPTHELASQVFQVAKKLSENMLEDSVKCALIIGGANMVRQMEQLKEKPSVVIGSPGRILDWIQKRKISAYTVKTIVIDEADRLLDSQNKAQVAAVIKTTLKDRQIAAFSATVEEQTKETCRMLMKEDLQLLSLTQRIPAEIEHYYILAERRDKFACLRKVLQACKPAKAMIFVNGNEDISSITDKLCFHNFRGVALMGEANGTMRQAALRDFRSGQADVLVTTDLSARGLDIEGIQFIFNLQMPEDPKIYLHRAGRCGRMGQQGTVVSFVEEKELKWLHRIEKEYNLIIHEKTVHFGHLAENN